MSSEMRVGQKRRRGGETDLWLHLLDLDPLLGLLQQGSSSVGEAAGIVGLLLQTWGWGGMKVQANDVPK